MSLTGSEFCYGIIFRGKIWHENCKTYEKKVLRIRIFFNTLESIKITKVKSLKFIRHYLLKLEAKKDQKIT